MLERSGAGDARRDVSTGRRVARREAFCEVGRIDSDTLLLAMAGKPDGPGRTGGAPALGGPGLDVVRRRVRSCRQSPCL
jgi:hypothetical protein